MPLKQHQRTFQLPPLTAAQLASLRHTGESKGKLQIGLRRNLKSPAIVDRKTFSQTEWLLLPDGSRLWSAEVHAEGARGLRLHLDGVLLPPEARLIVAPANAAQQGVAVDGLDLAGAGEIWLPTIFSDRVVFECQIPPSANLKDVAFSLDAVSHLYDHPVESLEKAGGCHNDVACYPGWQNAASGVARITFVEFGTSYICTGALLADNDPSSVAAFFLTARHCVNNQAVASTLEVYWAYQAIQCQGTSPNLSQVPTTLGGADFLTGRAATDFCLLRLRRTPPPGSFYLDWTAGPVGIGEPVTTIHHPGDAPKRISFGTVNSSDHAWWRVKWNSGVTEPGSSGAPLLNSRQQVIGQLYGGLSSCANPNGTDSYGRLDASFADLVSWLLPANGGEPEGPVVVPPGTYTGLFLQTDAPSINSSGAVTLKVAGNGSFSGSIRMNTGAYPFTGKFSFAGKATVKVRRGQWPVLTLLLNGDPGNQNITGNIGEGSWSGELLARRAGFDGSSSIAPQTGGYTLGLPGVEGEGHGFAVVKVTRAGVVTLAGKMPDGAAWSRSGRLSLSGDLAVWQSLYAARGLIQGWLNFGPDGSPTPTGTLTWKRPTLPSSAPLLVDLSVLGSRYAASSGGGLFLNDASRLTLQGAGLTEPLAYSVFPKTATKLGSETGASGKVNLTIGPNGLFTGLLKNSAELETVTLQGVVLPAQGRALGMFKYKGRPGPVEVIP